MKRFAPTAAVLALAASVAACGKKEAAAQAAPATSPPAAFVAKGSGTVRAVDRGAGTITLAHGPIPEANWPAMTMAFKAGPAVTGAAKPGERVDFDVKVEDGRGEVTAIRKQ